MTRDEFSAQIARLRDTYPKGYPDERVQAIWYRMKWLEARDFAEIITHLIGEHQHPPMLSKFEEAARKFYQKHAERLDQEERAWIEALDHCSLCNKTGIVMARHKRDPIASFVFRCPCQVGERKRFSYPEWDPLEHGDTYEIERYPRPEREYRINPEKLKTRITSILPGLPYGDDPSTGIDE